MASIEQIRVGSLNGFLNRRVDTETLPWTVDECDQAIKQALLETWPTLGIFVSGTVATNQNSPYYVIPASIEIVSRIVLEQVSAGVTAKVAEVPAWTPHVAGQVAIEPQLPTDTTLSLRFYGWKPYADDADDLPDRLMSLVAMKAASLAYGMLGAKLADSEDQMALDSGKVITQADAVGLSAYWQRRFEDVLRSTPNQLSRAPRAASRGR